MEHEIADITAEDLIAGQPCLDFVNTAGGDTKARGKERLVNYGALYDLAALAGLISTGEAASLRRLARASPDEADTALARVRHFKDDLFNVFTALAAAEDVPRQSWKAMTGQLTECLSASDLLPGAEGFKRWIELDRGGLDTILLRVGLLANDLMLSDDLRLIKNCDRCSWLYLDRSKGRRRRWCSMRACGNRAKVQRFARRQRADEGH